MTSSGCNKDQPKTVRKTVLDDHFIREFDRMIKDARAVNREYDENRRRRGL